MNLQAADGHMVLRVFKEADKGSKLVMPDNVALEDFPSFIVIDAGRGLESQYTGKRMDVPFKAGDRVIAAASRCVTLNFEGEKLFVVPWTSVIAKIV